MTSPRLLLVDDDPDLGFVVRILSRRCGHALAHRLDAESAWASLDAERPDLVLLDVNLPGTSGLEFLARLRTSPDRARQAVALFTQPALTRDLAAGWAAGADYHVSKDLVTRPDAWKQRLDEIVAHLRGRAAGDSLFIKNVAIPAARLESPQILLRYPSLHNLSGELLQAMLVRAGATGPSTPEASGECLLRLIDQVGCLFGQSACDRLLKDLRTHQR